MMNFVRIIHLQMLAKYVIILQIHILINVDVEKMNQVRIVKMGMYVIGKLLELLEILMVFQKLLIMVLWKNVKNILMIVNILIGWGYVLLQILLILHFLKHFISFYFLYSDFLSLNFLFSITNIHLFLNIINFFF